MIIGEGGILPTVNQVELDKTDYNWAHFVDYSRPNLQYTNVTVPSGYTLEMYLAMDVSDMESFINLFDVYDDGEDVMK